MDRTTKKIITELHRLDPDFKMDDPTLQKIVADFVMHKPHSPFDEAFSKRLRGELVKSPTPTSFASPYISLVTTRFFTGVAGALMTLLIVAPLTYILTKNTVEQGTEVALKDISTGLSLKQQITNKNNNAFGKLAYINPQPVQDTTVSENAPVAKSMVATAPEAPTPVPVIYAGAELKLTETEGKVYKRVKGIDAGKELANFLKNANFDVVNVGAFSKLSLETIQLSEDTPFGQTLSINFNEGTISVTPYSAQWTGDAKTTPQKITPEGLIDIANTYVHDHGIDVAGYGKPVVTAESVVTYPLLIDGIEVYEESGDVYGLQIVVDLKEKKVSSVNNLTSQIYEGSLYALETNSDKIIKTATGSTTVSTSKNIEHKIELQTPRRILVRYVLGESNELYVPALLFVAEEKGGTTPHSYTIVIPLVKDALDKISVASLQKVVPEEPIIEKSTPTPILPIKNSVE